MILEALQQAGEPLTPKQVAELLGKSHGAVKFLLFQMRHAGEVRADAHGRCMLSPAPAPAMTAGAAMAPGAASASASTSEE